MKYYSTQRKVKEVSFEEAIFKGLPDDNGLYMPEVIPKLPKSFFESAEDLPFYQLAFEVLSPFVKGEINPDALLGIVRSAFDFDIPLVHIHDQVYSLELFHGPTLAFKDFGARFMARAMAYFLKKQGREINILVATSGDTGSAVAQGFFEIPGIKVTILYPSGKVSKIQEKQLTTVGSNVHALEVEGTFDDCQRLVKAAFLDVPLNKKLHLSSANSINIARLLPQSLYYFHAWRTLAGYPDEAIFSVPSGNFGNLSGGILAKKMGLPVRGFIAATNLNRIVPDYIESGKFNPRSSIATISNAMDVGNPSNFQRMMALYNGDYNALKKEISGFYLDDEATRQVISKVYSEYDYLMCPHSAIGYEALKQNRKNFDIKMPGIFLSTASPSKFTDVVEPVINNTISMPERLQQIIDRKKQSTVIGSDYETFREFLLSQGPV
ncbi:MAG: threonine synthase [Cyclobacteriaceae bacterium]|nr:threonine synthase [Cyclobacteriaceae bacterium]